MEVLTVGLGDLKQTGCLADTSMQRWEPLSGKFYDAAMKEVEQL